jgi:hypothetical protein
LDSELLEPDESDDPPDFESDDDDDDDPGSLDFPVERESFR